MAALDGLEVLAVEERDWSLWRVFFRNAADRDAASAALSTANGLTVHATPVEVVDEDWARRSQAMLRSVRVGRFVISPPWDTPATSNRSDIVLVVEPSMGFGTGHHASTRLCLSALQQLEMGATEVLDVGTGSAVLAMAAARLGAASVVAVDIDADAISSAQDNLALNGLSGAVVLREADFRSEPAAHVDIVLANLTGGMLSMSAPTLLACCKAGGHMIMSGILASEESAVLDAFGDAVAVAWRNTEDEWVGLLLKKLEVAPQALQHGERH
jgi:ribosomal protein L11 methyltransferase